LLPPSDAALTRRVKEAGPSWTVQEEKGRKTLTEHATPAGSGTAARTQRIPIEKRAESPVIAWLRHGTTARDDMKIRRVGEVSQQLPERYSTGQEVDAELCPLQNAMRSHGE